VIDWPEGAVRDCVGSECRRPVLWTVSEWGWQRPLDPEPVVGGIVIVEIGPDDYVLSAIETKLDPPGQRWELHHWTCAARGRWLRQQSLRPGELRW
jgi:hypothetical protein